MNCRDVQVRVQALLDGDLPESESRQVEQHLSKCVPCARMKRDFDTLARLAKSELAARAPENFDRLLHRRLDTSRQHSWTRSFIPVSLAWGAAAVMLLGLFVTSGLFMPESEPVPETSFAFPQESVSPVVLPSEPGTPGMHLLIPGELDGMLVQVPSTVKFTRQQLTQDFFLSEVSH